MKFSPQGKVYSRPGIVPELPSSQEKACREQMSDSFCIFHPSGKAASEKIIAELENKIRQV